MLPKTWNTGILDLNLKGNRVRSRKSDKACLPIGSETELIAQTWRTKDSKTKWRPSLFLSREFRYFMFSATFKQNFFTRKTCLDGDKSLQATKTESKESVFEFGKKLWFPHPFSSAWISGDSTSSQNLATHEKFLPSKLFFHFSKL